MNKKLGLLLAILLVASALLTACASQPVIQTVEVPKEVVKTVEVSNDC